MERIDLACDGPNCQATFPGEETMARTILSSRGRGWHQFSGESLSGKVIFKALCPGCLRNMSWRRDPLTVLDGQETMF